MTRAVTDILFRTDGSPWASAPVTFERTAGSFDDGSSWPPDEKQVTTDATGAYSVQLWPDAAGSIRSRYHVTYPNGDVFYVSIPDGTTPISMPEIRVAAVAPPVPPSALDAHEAAPDPHDQYLLPAEGDLRYAALVHSQAWSTITTTPATLGGYGITDAATAAGLAAEQTARTNADAALQAGLGVVAGQVVNVKDPAYGATGNGTTDDSAAFLAALAALAQTGGVLWCPAGTYRVNSQILLANDGASPPKQKPIRITGPGEHFSGQGSAPSGGAILDLRYTGGGTGEPKIDTRGLGLLEIDHVTLTDAGTSSNPFVKTTNTTLHIHRCAFIGNLAKSGITCDQDCIVLGGLSATIDGSATAPFQGYGTVIESNYFNRIRRGVLGQTFANAVVIRDNTWWAQCGSNLGGNAAAIEFAPLAGQFCTGAYIGANLIETTGYTYGIRLATSVCFSLIGNNFYDPTGVTSAYIRLETTANYNLIIAGWGNDTKTHVSEAAPPTNTIIQARQSQQTTFAQPVRFSHVSGTTFAQPVYFAGGAMAPRVQPAATTSDGTILFDARRSAAEATNPGTTVWQLQQHGLITVGGAQAGNMIFLDAAGVQVLSVTGNGKNWLAAGAGGAMSQDSGTGGSYYTHKNFGVKFQDHNAGPLRMTVGAGLDGFTLGAAADTNLKRAAQDTLQTNDKFIADLGLVGQGGTTAARPATPTLYQQYFDATLGKPIWCSNATGPVWKDATGTTV